MKQRRLKHKAMKFTCHLMKNTERYGVVSTITRSYQSLIKGASVVIAVQVCQHVQYLAHLKKELQMLKQQQRPQPIFQHTPLTKLWVTNLSASLVEHSCWNVIPAGAPRMEKNLKLARGSLATQKFILSSFNEINFVSSRVYPNYFLNKQIILSELRIILNNVQKNPNRQCCSIKNCYLIRAFILGSRNESKLLCFYSSSFVVSWR